MSNYMRLKTCGFSFAVGVSWGLATSILGFLGWKLGLGLPLIQMLGSLYKGYAPTLMGSLIGGGWGFLDGFIAGLIIAVVYNTCCCCGKRCQSR